MFTNKSKIYPFREFNNFLNIQEEVLLQYQLSKIFLKNAANF